MKLKKAKWISGDKKPLLPIDCFVIYEAKYEYQGNSQ